MAATEGRVKPFRVPGILAVLLIAVAAHLSLAETGPGNQVSVIDRDSFRVASPMMISYEELAGLVALRPGDRLTSAAIRESKIGRASCRERV